VGGGGWAKMSRDQFFVILKHFFGCFDGQSPIQEKEKNVTSHKGGGGRREGEGVGEMTWGKGGQKSAEKLSRII
jgi:hypothetical protein